MNHASLILVGALVCTIVTIGEVQAQSRQYEVTVTNLTRGQTFTPILVATHKRSTQLFELGTAASSQLMALAEEGDTSPLATLLEGSADVSDVTIGSGLLEPGESVTVEISSRGRSRDISLAAMLVPTNDAFVALNAVALPRKKSSTVAYMAVAYDAGTEPNDESCANIPGPVCGGSGAPDDGAEGYVHVHAGIHGIADVSAAAYDWRNPVARVSIERVR